MDYNSYVRKPFKVQAVLVTDENIAEIAKLTGVLEKNDDETLYIEVDRLKVPNVFKIYVGFFVTKMNKQFRAFPPQVFEKLFVKNDEELEKLIKDLNGRTLSTT